jgi:hypothetical protein
MFIGAGAPLLSLSGAKACFCALGGSLELAHARRAGRPLSIGLGLVQVVALAGVLSLCSQIVQVPGGHGFESRTGVSGRGARSAVEAERRSASGDAVQPRVAPARFGFDDAPPGPRRDPLQV